MILMKRWNKLYIEYIIVASFVNNTFTTVETQTSVPDASISPVRSILTTNSPSTITASSTAENPTDDSYYEALCFNNVLSPQMSEFYDNFEFKYDDIYADIKNITAQNIPGQSFYINHRLVEKIFHDLSTTSALNNIVRVLNVGIVSNLNIVKNTMPSKIDKFLKSYLIKRLSDFPDMINKNLKKEYKINQILDDLCSCKSCPVMFSQLYFISVLKRILTKLIPADACGRLSNDELNFILLKDIISIFDIFKTIKTKMDHETLMLEFNHMLQKRTNTFSQIVSSMFVLHWIDEPSRWSKRMSKHLKYECVLSTIQRLFRTRVEAFKSEIMKIGKSLEVINLIIDTMKTDKFDQKTNNKLNEILLNSIDNIENSYFMNKANFVTRNKEKILQDIDSRISFKRTYMKRKYVLNMIFFDDQNETNNDIFLYNVRSKYVLNVYKVFNTMKFESFYDGSIEKLNIWTLTDQYDLRMSINLIKDEDDIIDIVNDVLKGLRDLETNSIFYSNIGIDDIVVCDVTDPKTKTVSRKYKLDLKRAYKVDDYEIKMLEKDLDYYHNSEIQDFMVFFQQIISHLNLPAICFRKFIDFSKKKNESGRLSEFSDLLERVPKKIKNAFF